MLFFEIINTFCCFRWNSTMMTHSRLWMGSFFFDRSKCLLKNSTLSTQTPGMSTFVPNHISYHSSCFNFVPFSFSFMPTVGDMCNHRWQTIRHLATWRKQNEFDATYKKKKHAKMEEFLRTMHYINIGIYCVYLVENVHHLRQYWLTTSCYVFMCLCFHEIFRRFSLFIVNFIWYTLTVCALCMRTKFHVRIDATTLSNTK